VVEPQNLTLAGHPVVVEQPIVAGHSTVTGCPIIAKHPSVAAQPLVVGQPIATGHPTLTGYGMSTQWQNVQDRVPQQQPTLHSWEDIRRQEAW
jgi:hypothetical protein